MKLYELSNAYRMVLEAQEDAEFAQALADIIDSFDAKVESLAKVIRTLEAEANAYDVEAKRLSDSKQARQNRADHLKQYLLGEMQLMHKEKVQGQILTVAIQQSPPSCQVLNEDEIPGEFKEIVQTVKVDRRSIIEGWKVGEIIPGVEISQSQHIRIRP